MSGSEKVAKLKGIAKDLLWGIVLLGFIALIGITVAGWFGAGGDTDSSREQRQGESDYQYQERLRAEDEELHKDCGFRPAC